MFAQSTQLKNWIFPSEEAIKAMRIEANKNFCEKFGYNIPREQWPNYFLSPHEEKYLAQYYEMILCDFCKKFQPPMTRNVVGTSMHYFKRFYLNNSIMDYHPKQILVTCVYLATKIDEFTVSLSQFVGNVRGDREKAMAIILNNELLLMQKLNYNLHVFNPYRPLEGFIIDLKTQFPELEYVLDSWRPYMDDLMDKLFFTDAILLYPPSQLALAVLDIAAAKHQHSLESYIKHLFSNPEGQEKYASFRAKEKQINTMIKSIEPCSREFSKSLEKKLENCRNQENNPDSEVYKRKMQELLDEDEREQTEKYQKEAERQRLIEEELMNSHSFDGDY